MTWVNTRLLLPIPVCKVSGLCAKKSINIWHSIGFSVTWFKPKRGNVFQEVIAKNSCRIIK